MLYNRNIQYLQYESLYNFEILIMLVLKVEKNFEMEGYMPKIIDGLLSFKVGFLNVGLQPA